MDISQQILSDITVHMKYAKYLLELNRRETWEEIVYRNKEMHKKKFKHLGLDFLKMIDNAYEFVYQKKICPSMRSMQFAGKPIEISPNRVYNCAYLPIDDYRAFGEIMFLLLGGTGIGYSVQKHHVEKLPEIRRPTKKRRFLISDSIEGWADAIKALMKAYFSGKSLPVFDFSDIRVKGAALITSGGKAPGPEPLKDCLHNLKKVFDRKHDGNQLSTLEAHDMVCYIADAVLAGGIRRAALISLFSMDDEEMAACKFGNWWEENPQRGRSNNSACIARHRIKKYEFKNLWKKIEKSNAGEPGIYFTNDIEWGTNPCCEIALRAFQFCNLTEINVSNVESQEDLNERAAAAAFLGTLQASYTDFHYLRDIWKRTTEKDALIGVGMTGIASKKIFDFSLEKAADIVKSTNKEISKLIGINEAARMTCIKPSGTSSLVLGCSSGIHAWHNDYYIRRIRVGKNEAIYSYLSIYHPELLEDCFFKPKIDAVISIPQKAPDYSIYRTENAIDLLERIKYFHENWIDSGHSQGNNSHNVSATVSIKNEEWDNVGEWMWKNRKHYNGLACLPFDGGSYVQAPFEDCDSMTFDKLFSKLHEIDLTKVIEMNDNTNLKGELACSSGVCEIV